MRLAKRPMDVVHAFAGGGMYDLPAERFTRHLPIGVHELDREEVPDAQWSPLDALRGDDLPPEYCQYNGVDRVRGSERRCNSRAHLRGNR